MSGHYYSLNEYLQRSFGGKLYKLALDGGFTCPNRDGTLDTRGCIFCSGRGSGNFAEFLSASATETLDRAIARVASKGNCVGYIAYFQNYTGTYAPVERLESLYRAVLEDERVKVLSIATRPDCLGDEVMELLKELNREKPVWIELGLQTIHPQTAEYIRRGYPLEVFDSAVKRCRQAGLEVIVHMILGLPGESDEMICQTAEYVGKSGANGIKLQLLHVLKGTDLAADYAAGKFSAMELEHYIQLLENCIRVLPPEMVIHRLTGDGDKRELIAPLWTADKKRVLNAIRSAFERDGLIQGEKIRP
ncbi:MAG: TIGR01212 family radical SAM protein [Oscillospiraceae bacterium]|nr:TIGR01212 family radical SAM protein [Oscillospiraceae bacterium]